MARVQKLYDRLDALESEIRQRLLSEGKRTTFFLIGDYGLLPGWLNCPETKALLDLADEALALRNKLGESQIGAIGERLRTYCYQAMNSSDHNRLGPQRLARQFLIELGEQVDTE